ncbi:uncharacterized protein LOC141702349, partial [Apium graveolens]|uniref:uncharacterized protein LOC141702349 n=1 Tax=Apium graveolens TaxID=4045 RepID=UPI003D78CB27
MESDEETVLHGLNPNNIPKNLREASPVIQARLDQLVFLRGTAVDWVKHGQIEEVRKEVGFAGCITVEARGHSGGLALMWKNEGGCTIKEIHNHFIDFEVENEQIGRWRYTGRSDLPWCIIGDFNDLLFTDEKQGGRPHPSNLLYGFGETIRECNLVDLGYVGGKYTWDKSRGTSKWIQERLDRGLATQEWRELFPLAEVHVLEVAPSDHLPLHLQLNKKVYVPRSKRFKFENVWLKEKDCFNLVKDSWDRTGGREILEKINFCCLKLEEWGGGINQEYKRKMINCRQELRILRSRRDRHGAQRYNEVREEYLNLLERQEMYWKQRAKQFWLQEGDRNTRFFHRYASARKNKNSIKRLRDANGDWCDTEEGIQGVVTTYFDQLFKSTEGGGKLSPRETVNQVTGEENEDLLAPVTKEE